MIQGIYKNEATLGSLGSYKEVGVNYGSQNGEINDRNRTMI